MLAANGYRYAIAIHLSRVLLVPEGIRMLKPENVSTAIVFEGGFKFMDLQNRSSHQLPVDWDAEPRPLEEWSAANGMTLTDEMKKA